MNINQDQLVWATCPTCRGEGHVRQTVVGPKKGVPVRKILGLVADDVAESLFSNDYHRMGWRSLAWVAIILFWLTCVAFMVAIAATAGTAFHFLCFALPFASTFGLLIKRGLRLWWKSLKERLC